VNTPEDLIRSVRRWFGVVLPEPWDIQYQRTDDLDRPSVIVQPSTGQLTSGSAYIRQNQRDFQAFVYPTGFEGDPPRSRVEAEGFAYTLERAMAQGFKPDGLVYYSRALRLPVFDYADVPWDQGQPSDALPYDYLPVANFGTDVRVDPDDDSLFTVVVDMRITWTTLGDISRFDGPLMTDMRVTAGAL
jgi:hypothetical protein